MSGKQEGKSTADSGIYTHSHYGVELELTLTIGYVRLPAAGAISERRSNVDVPLGTDDASVVLAPWGSVWL